MQKNKIKPAWYYCELYKMNFYFFIGWNAGKYAEYVLKNYNYELNNISSCDGNCLSIDIGSGHGKVICTRDKRSISTLAHECLHASIDTLTMRGIDIRDSNGETLAYYMEFLMEKALET